MDTRPVIGEYKRTFVSIVLQIVAMITFIAGLIEMVLGFSDSASLGVAAIYIGLAAIISSFFLFGFTCILEDIHYQSYLKLYYGEESYNYHMQELQKLHNIELLLSSQYQPQQPPHMSQQPPYMPTTSMPDAQNTQPQNKPDDLATEVENGINAGC